MPAARTTSRAARRSATDGARPTMSSGVHRAPRANTGTPLTWTNRPSRSTSWSARAPALRVRKPIRPPSIAVSPTPPTTRRRTAYRAGSPWVWGHHRRTPAIRISPVAVTSPAACVGDERRATRRLRIARTVDDDVDGRRDAPVEHPQPDVDRKDSVVALDPRAEAQVLDDEPRRRSSVIGRHGPTAAGRGENPGMRPSSIVRNQRRLLSATSRVRQPGSRPTLRRQLRCQRAAADRELVVAGHEAPRRRRRRAPGTSTRSSGPSDR